MRSLPFSGRRLAVAAGTLAVVALAAGSMAASAATTHQAASSTLVVDKSFDLKTSDPQRQFEPTGGIIDHAMYDSLLKFVGADSAHPKPSVAASYKASADAKTYTFQLRKTIKFSDGTPLTSKDVVFSFNRLVNLKGNPSFLLAGITTKAKGPYTVVLSSKTANPAIPVLVANTSLGIVNSKVVQAHGGSAAVGADKKDKAESYLNAHSAGSGPYTLKSFSTTSQVVLTANPTYWGLVGKSNINVAQTPSPNMFFLFANHNPSVSATSSNPHIQNAIRLGLDYSGLVTLVGTGAVQATGVVPSMFLGALKAGSGLKTDVAKAKAEVAASGISNPTLSLEFPSDFTSNGLSFGVIAQRIQSDLGKIGITVNLAGSPIATSLGTYRAGTEQLGLWYWGPDYPDPNDYLAFLPGATVGLRAGWPAGADATLEALGKKASAIVSPTARGAAFQQIQTQLNANGPFFPLFQPGQVTVSSKNLTNNAFNALYWMDVAAVGSN
jgi:peptide/nickel transport system substrate-binding protein